MGFKFSLIYLIVALLIFGGFVREAREVRAQSSDILVEVTPLNPAPLENVTIRLNSYANNLDSVSITWFVGGKNVLSGIGKKSFSINAPTSGSETTVTAIIALPEGQTSTKIIIRPATTVLLWQANDSYVPPFYRGKALPSADSEIKVVAMPEVKTSSGTLVDSKNMIYAWKKDYTNDQEASGYGKNFFLYTNDYLEGSNTIGVTAQTVDGRSSSEASIDIGTTQPKILFYKNDNGIGTIWEKVLDSHRIQGEEIVVAIPYFISPKEIQNPRLVWSWFINNNPVSVLSLKKNVMPLKVEAGTHGTSKLRLEIENKDKIFQTASKEINIEF